MNRILLGMAALLWLSCAQKVGEPATLGPEAVLATGSDAPAATTVELAPVGAVQSPRPSQTTFVEPLKPPRLAHRVRVSLVPSDAVRVSAVRSVHVRVEVVGSDGVHEVAAVFTAPSRTTYARQASQLSGTAFDTQVVEYDLPVSGTFIDQHQLTGHWQLVTTHDGVEQAATSFELAP